VLFPKRYLRIIAWLVAVLWGPSIAANPPILPMTDVQQVRPELPEVLPMRDRAEVRNRILEHRLDTVIPEIMREQEIDLWLLMAREYFEEPVAASMLNAESMSARRRTILVFFDPGNGMPIERLTVSRYGLGGLFTPAWDPEQQPDQWQAVADLIAERDPERVAINFSDLKAFGDGMTLSQYRAMTSRLAPKYVERIVSGETLAVRWLETRTEPEVAIYPGVVRIAHSLIGQALSDAVITPGTTTAADVQWWYRERLAKLGLKPWFQPSLGIQRNGVDGMLYGDEVIQHGDLLWTDFGITYLGLSTDTQHLAYVLKPGETKAPKGLIEGLRNSNVVQDILTSHYQVGASGNQVLEAARSEAISQGLDPSIYTHPIGIHGHGAGPAIGFWDDQSGNEHGEDRIRPNTAWAIELTSYSAVPEWDGQRVDFRTEEDAFFDGETVRFLNGRQTELTLIPSN